ncbi:MAG TPA: hypothetical protein VIB08_04690 [Thermoanaerobaculia bacterium]
MEDLRLSAHRPAARQTGLAAGLTLRYELRSGVADLLPPFRSGDFLRRELKDQ